MVVVGVVARANCCPFLARASPRHPEKPLTHDRHLRRYVGCWKMSFVRKAFSAFQGGVNVSASRVLNVTRSCRKRRSVGAQERKNSDIRKVCAMTDPRPHRHPPGVPNCRQTTYGTLDGLVAPWTISVTRKTGILSGMKLRGCQPLERPAGIAGGGLVTSSLLWFFHARWSQFVDTLS